MKCKSKILHINVRLPSGRLIPCEMNQHQTVRDLEDYVSSQIGNDVNGADRYVVGLVSGITVLDADTTLSTTAETVAIGELNAILELLPELVDTSSESVDSDILGLVSSSSDDI